MSLPTTVYAYLGGMFLVATLGLLAWLVTPSKQRLDVYETLRNAKWTDDFPGYESAPHISERVWDAIGVCVRDREVQTERRLAVIPAASAFTLRLQVSKPKGVDIEEELIDAAMNLLHRFHGSYAYIQQGEVTVLVEPSSSNSHIYGGRREVLVTNATAILGASFASLLSKGAPLTITCRIAAWDSTREAFQLLLHRAYTGLRNGVNQVLGPRLSQELVGLEQLEWCHEHQRWPQGHQAYGTLIEVTKGWLHVQNQYTGTPYTVDRRKYDFSSRNLLNSYVKYTGF